MKTLSLKILGLFLLITCIATAQTAHAQSNGNVESLPEILNDPATRHTITPADLARDYYRQCVQKDNLVLTKEEVDILCSCSAAKMPSILNKKQIRHLTRKTKTGREARDIFRSSVYAPCMEYVVEDKVDYECRKSKILHKVIRGKKAVCKCAKEKMKRFVNENATSIILNSAELNHMTLDPLSDYFTRNDYYGQRDYTIQKCYDKIRYSKENR